MRATGDSSDPSGPDGGPGLDGPDLGDLMHVAFRRLRHRWSEQLAPFELTPYQFRALQAVGGGHGHGHAHADHAPAHGPAAGGPGPGGEGACGEDACGAVDAAQAEGLRLKDIADRLRIAARSATEVVDQLEAKGLVERRPDPADRRATRIRLTRAGVGMRAAVREARRREAGDYFSVLPERDQAELRRLLTALARGA
jgi:DNA-binding MarR family transcriptional regulator